MGRFIDLTGRKFAKLLVIKRIKNYKQPSGQEKTIWYCLCDCGKEISVLSNHLLNNNTQSCGCYQKEKTSKLFVKNLTGQRFGRLIAQYDFGRDEKGRVIWHCICDCGKEKDVFSSRLINGTTQSCGCYQKEKISETHLIDLTGKFFGRLMVDYQSGRNKKGYVIWHCVCSCGNKIYANSALLINGSIKSCGCLSESFIASELKKFFVDNSDAQTEYRILKNPKTKRWLPYDIYISKDKNSKTNGIYIEINGKQHYVMNSFYKLAAKENNTTPEEEFKYQQYKDQLKIDFAKNNGIYIEIDLREIKTVKEGIKYIKGKLECQNLINIEI